MGSDRQRSINEAAKAAASHSILLAALLACGGVLLPAAAQQPNRRRAELHRLPIAQSQATGLEERISRGGFEASRGPFHVVAPSAEEARQVVLLADEAWRQTAALTEHFAPAALRPAVPRGAVQIDVGEHVQSGESQSPAIVVGSQVRIFVSLGADRPPLDKQTSSVRAATAAAFLHLAELDRQLPAWVCRGLAAYVGSPAGPPEAGNGELVEEATAVPRPLNDSGRFASSAAAETGSGFDDVQAAALVRFLIEGSDAAHAPTFFAALAEQIRRCDPDRNRESAEDFGEAPTSMSLTELIEGLEEEFSAWQAEPQLGQPLPQDPLASDADTAELQRQMWFILKLAHRFGATESSGVKSRVTQFDKTRGQAVVSRNHPQTPPAVELLFARLTDPSRAAWATLDPAGALLVKGEEERLRELLGLPQRQFRFVAHEAGWALQTRLADGRQATAWLVPNPDQQRRPIAKFEVAGGSGR